MAKRRERPEKITPAIQALRDVGIKARNFKRAPAGTHVFYLNTDPLTAEKDICIHEGDAKVEVLDADPNLKQAVLKVEEERHTIDAKRKYHERNAIKKGRINPNWFPTALPTGSRVKVLKTKPDPKDKNGGGMRIAELQATVPHSIQHFLVGMDEHAQFISALPKEAKTVEEAHQVLKPARLKEEHKRQGEWFFEPVELSNAQVRELWRKARFRRLEAGSFHSACVAVVDKVQYAIGIVMDRRAGRHDPVDLDTWHRVKRNKERVVKNRRARGWD